MIDLLRKRCLALIFLASLAQPLLAQEGPVEIIVDPGVVQLRGPQAVYSLLVTGKSRDGQLVDLTHTAKYQSLRPAVAKISALGVIHAIADGKTEIVIEAAGKTAKI